MTRTTEPTTKAERDNHRACHSRFFSEEQINALLDDADERDALRRRVAVLEGACKMTVSQWDDVCVPGAACEGCPEPDYVAACRAALSASPPATPDPNADQTKQDVFSRQIDVLDGKVVENPLPNPMHTRY